MFGGYTSATFPPLQFSHQFRKYGNFTLLYNVPITSHLQLIEPCKEPKGVNFKDDHKSDRYTNARKSIFVPASRSQLGDDEDDNEFEQKTVQGNRQTSQDESDESQVQIQNAFLTTESSSDQLKKSSTPPKSPTKAIHIHTHIPSVPINTFDTEAEPDHPEMMTSSDDPNPKVNVYKVFDRIS